MASTNVDTTKIALHERCEQFPDEYFTVRVGKLFGMHVEMLFVIRKVLYSMTFLSKSTKKEKII